ncbi:MAG: hypothetical protein NTX50_06710 [Candidatus Sumerlaeota bacterium]|nr:hypothetical protein [Candidatus Sumerlaeota bacterium]
MTVSSILQRRLVVVLCLCACGCFSTVRKTAPASLRFSLPLLGPEDYETLETVEGYGSRLLICGIPFGDGHYAYVNCPLKTALPEEARQRPDVFKQNPVISDVAILGGIIVGEFVLPFPMWIFLFEYEPSLPRDAVASAVSHALKKQPQADTFLPQTVTVWRSGFWLLYQREWARVEGKAIRIKNDKERFGG